MQSYRGLGWICDSTQPLSKALSGAIHFQVEVGDLGSWCSPSSLPSSQNTLPAPVTTLDK